MSYKLSTRHALAALAAVVSLLAVTSCAAAPAAPVPDDPTAAKAVLSPNSGPASSFITVAAPNNVCSSAGYGYLQAALTIKGSGIVISQGYQDVGSGGISGYASNDSFVRLRVPPATAAGAYNVFLTCYSYLDNYQFAPATFTVTSGF